MMVINKNVCTGCSLCIKDCLTNSISLINNKANITNFNCLKCGHCIAICPKNAIYSTEYNMCEVKNYNKESFSISPNNLLNFIKFRRSVRNFKNKKVETEKLSKIIESGRFTQTSSNNQNTSYIVVKDNIDVLKKMAIESLYDYGKSILSNLTPETKPLKKFAYMWLNIFKKYNSNPTEKDLLFFNAPVIILTISDSEIDASLASSNMELMTNALGLGTFFSGFFVKATQYNKDIRDFLGLDKNKQVITCMVIGYPDVNYLRTVPRKEANIKWI